MLEKCDYIAIKCPCAGEGAEVRQAVPSAPASETTECPKCHEQRGFTTLGPGYTLRPLPFHEIYRQTVDYASVEGNGRKKIPWSGKGVAKDPVNSGRLAS
jgi:cytochrome c553